MPATYRHPRTPEGRARTPGTLPGEIAAESRQTDHGLERHEVVTHAIHKLNANAMQREACQIHHTS